MPDRGWITMSFPAPLIFRYHLPLTYTKNEKSGGGDIRGTTEYPQNSDKYKDRTYSLIRTTVFEAGEQYSLFQSIFKTSH